MNIICDKSKLIEGINIVLKAIPSKSTMTILECLVIEVKEGYIKLIANDLEIGNKIGARDHSTAMHGNEKIEDLLKENDTNTIQNIDILKKKIDPQ